MQIASPEMQNNRDFLLKALRLSWKESILEYVPEAFWADREIVLAAVRRSGSALQYAGDELRRDRKKRIVEALRESDVEK